MGRLEYFDGNQWTTICGNEVNYQVAQVFCKSLGLHYLEAEIIPNYGGGYGHIWHGNIQCDGTEKKVFDCGHDIIQDAQEHTNSVC